MNETVTTERARSLLNSLFVSEHADISLLIAEALEGRDRIEKLTGVLECANATARRRGEHIAELTASLNAAQTKGISQDEEEKCGECGGTGERQRAMPCDAPTTDCLACHGSGKATGEKK